MNTKQLGRWRKLWTQPSPEWENLPAVARGIGDELVRYCDEEGRIPLRGLEPYRAAMRRLRAHPSERRAIERAVEQLIADGFAVVTPDALVVRNFVTAQRGLTDSGERTKTWRDRQETADVPESDRGTTVDVPRNDRGRTGERPRTYHGRTTDVPGSSQTTANSQAGNVPGTPLRREESRGEKSRVEGQSAGAPETTPPHPTKALDPKPDTDAKPGSREDAFRCPSREPASPPPQRDAGPALIAALSAAAGDAMRVGAPAEVQLRFIAACHEAGVTVATLRTLGAYLRFHREQHADQYPWRNGRSALDLAFFDYEGGVRLVEFVGRALDWHTTHHATSALAQSKRAHERAAVDAAIAASAGVDPQRSAQLAREARAALAAMRPADATRKAS